MSIYMGVSINVGMSRSIVKFSFPFLEVKLCPCLTADVEVMVYALETSLPMTDARKEKFQQATAPNAVHT